MFAREKLDYEHVEASAYAQARYLEELNREALRNREHDLPELLTGLEPLMSSADLG
jgi:hypothetical protein